MQKLKIYKFMVPALVLVAIPLQVLAVKTCTDTAGNSVEVSDIVDCEGGKSNVIYAYLAPIIQFLAVGIGLVVVLMIIISGIQYITSGSNPDGAAAAKKRMGNAILGLIVFIFMVAILNYLIPGGLL